MKIWKPIPGYPGYEASTQGQIRSFWMRGPRRRLGSLPRIIEGWIDEAGYRMVGIYDPEIGKHAARFVARLVLFAHRSLPPAPEMEAAHLDGIPGNNDIGNLVWATTSQNQMHRVEHGTSNRGSNHGLAQLTESDVLEIKRRLTGGENYSAIAKDYPVSKWAVAKIKSGRNWGWLRPC